MCIIIDASAVGRGALTNPGCKASAAVLGWLQAKNGRIAYGGTQSIKEIAAGSAKYRRLLRVLNQSGQTIEAPKDAVDQVANVLESECRSNDPHVVALARVSGARLLWSFDEDLRTDFGSKELLLPPHRGKVFNSMDGSTFHDHLLGKTCNC